MPRERPDVVLMDVRMPGWTASRPPGGSPPTALPATRVLILTTFDLDEYVSTALRAGASGFLLKDTLPDELLAAIRVVAAGTRCWPRRDPAAGRASSLATARRGGRRQPPALDTLTDRELEVLRPVANGLSNAEIADALYM